MPLNIFKRKPKAAPKTRLTGNTRFSIEVKGWEQALQLFDSIKLNTAETRELFNQLGAEMVKLGETLSPVDPVRQYDNRRRPIEDSFSRQWQFEVDTLRSERTIQAMELRVGNTDERAGWIIEGTPPRRIPLRLTNETPPMWFWWQDGPDGPDFYEQWVIRGGVAAHGTPPHPVPDEILREINFPDILHLLSMRIVK